MGLVNAERVVKIAKAIQEQFPECTVSGLEVNEYTVNESYTFMHELSVHVRLRTPTPIFVPIDPETAR